MSCEKGIQAYMLDSVATDQAAHRRATSSSLLYNGAVIDLSVDNVAFRSDCKYVHTDLKLHCL